MMTLSVCSFLQPHVTVLGLNIPIVRCSDAASTWHVKGSSYISMFKSYNKVLQYYLLQKAVPLQAMVALEGRGSIAPTHSCTRH
jgi:hypothetical protein